jgi:hypothetical protein
MIRFVRLPFWSYQRVFTSDCMPWSKMSNAPGPLPHTMPVSTGPYDSPVLCAWQIVPPPTALQT